MNTLTRRSIPRVTASILFMPIVVAAAPIAVVAVLLHAVYDVADQALSIIEELIHD